MSTIQEKASKWDSLIKWIKENADDYDTDIWEKLDELGVSTNGEEVKVKSNRFEEEDCVCGNNKHKGFVDNEMRCEDCDIDGYNYDGGLTDYYDRDDSDSFSDSDTCKPDGCNAEYPCSVDECVNQSE